MTSQTQTLITAAIFDLDGVIVDTAKYHYLAWKRLAQEFSINLTHEDNEKLKGVSRMDSLDIILAMGNVSLTKEEKEKLADKKNTWFMEYVNQMLQELRAKGIKISLGSSSKNAKTVLQLLNIENLFDAIADGTMITKSKPNPEIFFIAANLLSAKPEHCVVFEDAEAGVEAALAAGMYCVGVGSPASLGKAHQVVQDLQNFKFQLKALQPA
jgi:beta-phosphoglucomutase